ncbi:Chromosome segregation ATPase-like protein [Reticulomyxa filosa]|uniref:Chromosome segregation ATPase-like protein n=1 Tax=Reticulomyxa filosa TaxID=46433 RepID=X6NZ73_RETFI|nr:Chromosome segregation ATPase-like protein [Reticulomyxa filosa]|eukprot:ETO31183.1 Chromosome segregation ATPase-like protein [Reticulomyxa filosa]
MSWIGSWTERAQSGIQNVKWNPFCLLVVQLSEAQEAANLDDNRLQQMLQETQEAYQQQAAQIAELQTRLAGYEKPENANANATNIQKTNDLSDLTAKMERQTETIRKLRQECQENKKEVISLKKDVESKRSTIEKQEQIIAEQVWLSLLCFVIVLFSEFWFEKSRKSKKSLSPWATLSQIRRKNEKRKH